MSPEALNAAMADLGWKGSELVRRAGIVPNTVWRWRKGLTPIPPWLGEYLRAMLAIKRLQVEFIETTSARPPKSGREVDQEPAA